MSAPYIKVHVQAAPLPIHFLLVMHLGKHKMLIQEPGPMLPTWETQTELLAFGFRLVQSADVATGGMN